MNKNTLKILGICFGLVVLLSSCRGMKIKHGKDCGCGSFGHIELKQDRPQ